MGGILQEYIPPPLIALRPAGFYRTPGTAWVTRAIRAHSKSFGDRNGVFTGLGVSSLLGPGEGVVQGSELRTR